MQTLKDINRQLVINYLVFPENSMFLVIRRLEMAGKRSRNGQYRQQLSEKQNIFTASLGHKSEKSSLRNFN